jgi:hypothetical protein
MDEVTKYDPKRLLESRKGIQNRSLNAVHDTFDLIGGVPALALWADENPTDFYTKIWNRTIPSKVETEHSGEIIIRTAISRSPLDGEFTDVIPTEGPSNV